MYKHKKKYGQNFLDSNLLLEKITEAVNLSKDDNVIEIGPGEGFLTKMLVEHAGSLTCYEIDADLIANLNKKFSKYDTFTLVNQDFMDVDIKGDNIKVIANIPYYITSPIIQKLLENREHISEIYLMVQKEVGERIIGKNKSILTHSVDFYAQANYLFTVNKELFTPVPKVDSAFISIKIRKDKKYENMVDDQKFFEFLKIIFSNKRKTIANNLKPYFSAYKISNINNAKKRAEELSICEVIEMMKELSYV